ncbi:DUF6517 family protein [Halosolutus halophilus]|uniref:DUF6517 family protein n=1 Tax=Halosolutus halophilus TaxID=1552990 RepID=UPI002234FC6C|nr:DUF6517 family protein [Halosolutus halophilus]
MDRRTVLAGAGSIGLASLAGCLGLTGLDSHESQPAGVEAGVREETGYEQTEIESLEIEETFEVGPYSETITVTNHLTEHEKAVDMGPLGNARGAVFLLLTTPQVSIAGREFNPVGEMSTTELVDLVEDNYDGIDDISREADETVTVLDQETTMSRFTASAEFEGQSVDVFLHLTEAVETEDDLLVAIGVYPSQVRSMEESNVHDLVAGVVEEADESESTGSADDGGDGADGDE